MNVITLRDYAKQNNISYEAVRKQVVRYQDELAGHLIKDGRQQFLDEEAVAFLDARRQKNPVAIIQIEKDEKIEQLENENKQLLLKLAAVQDALLTEKDKTDALLAEKRDEIALLEADNEAARVKVAEAEENAQKAAQELVEVKGDLDKLKTYAAAQKARADFFATPWIKRIGKKAPELPELKEVTL